MRCRYCKWDMKAWLTKCPRCEKEVRKKAVPRVQPPPEAAAAIRAVRHVLKLPLTLGGTLFLHNGVERDYCFEHTLQSMVDVCDQVALIDAESTDGTLEVLQKWQARYPAKIKLESRPWKPGAGGFWLRDLTNEARNMLTTDMHLLMGGDEVIHPKQYPLLRELSQKGRMVQFRRFNFRASAWHITPMNRGGGGDWFRRMGPREVPAECDGGDLEDWPDTIHGDMSGLELYHYGQARTAKGFVTRSRDMLGAYYGLDPNDSLLLEVEKHGMKMLCESKSGVAVPWNDMTPFTGEHPPAILPWLRERGYEV